jgi:hypothetical protein
VIANIKYCEGVSPSYAQPRRLIAAVREDDRDEELKALLAQLDGPPPPSEPSGPPSPHRHLVDSDLDPESRSSTEQIAEIPRWLAEVPIPWACIADAVYDDERSGPPRVLTGERGNARMAR